MRSGTTSTSTIPSGKGSRATREDEEVSGIGDVENFDTECIEAAGTVSGVMVGCPIKREDIVLGVWGGLGESNAEYERVESIVDDDRNFGGVTREELGCEVFDWTLVEGEGDGNEQEGATNIGGRIRGREVRIVVETAPAIGWAGTTCLAGIIVSSKYDKVLTMPQASREVNKHLKGECHLKHSAWRFGFHHPLYTRMEKRKQNQ